MNLLGIDYGTKRIGLSFADELGIALPIPAIRYSKVQDLFAALGIIIKERKISALVIGYPFNMDGSKGTRAKEVDIFIAQLEADFQLPIHRVDERLTSYQAETELGLMGRRSGRGGGKKDRQYRQSGDLDSRAATIILQDYLEANS